VSDLFDFVVDDDSLIPYSSSVEEEVLDYKWPKMGDESYDVEGRWYASQSEKEQPEYE
jgi:hypothetical protein